MVSVSKLDCWETLYMQGRGCEWYYHLESEAVSSILRGNCLRVLHCGCGVAPFPNLSNCPVVVNFDFAESALIAFRNNPKVEALIADARYIPLCDASVDVVWEKGLFDSMTADSSCQVANAERILNEYHRVLAADGVAVIVSIFGPNAEEKDMFGLLCHFGFRIELREQLITPFEVPSQQFCFMYILHKL